MGIAIDTGLRGEVTRVVSDDDTAIAYGSGSVPVLSTPCVVTLCEQAAVAAVADRLPAGVTTVGMRVQVDHLRPTSVGRSITAEAVLRHVEGRRLTFAVSVDDDRGLVAAGKVTRVIVEIERFMDKAT
ncbi:MAG TPA: hotdog domain-containing protein [Ilumatobacteraceae bacterium]|nr:hotdog domain-containing protein [Ilumatobacteraceae bacterium]